MRESLRHLILSLFFGGLLLSPLLALANSSPAPSLWAHLDPHPDFPIEWWYMTGYLTTGEKIHQGFQATFFRMTNQGSSSSAGGPWSPREIFGFHGALSDLDRKTFLATERERRGFSRSVLAKKDPFSVRIGRNRLDLPKPSSPSLALVFRVGNQSFNLALTPLSPPVWHAARKKFFTGPSQKDWAFYYSYPLVMITGTVTTVGSDGAQKTRTVHGQCWFDHEWMVHSLAKDQIGWIWVWAWNKKNTRGLMLYQMLDRGVRLSPFHRATVLERKGVDWTVTRTRNVRLLKGKNDRCLDLSRIAFLVGGNTVVRVHPEIDRQLLTGAVSYWEGAARITLGPSSAPESGKGYLEVTGLESLREGSLCRDRH
ncbi:MAG: carotenoid 1,2-hydratase [Nitrospiraceae bacterium]|nr:carotenoid 1,2-hydratase [Nitrospiraceae bacterium]